MIVETLNMRVVLTLLCVTAAVLALPTRDEEDEHELPAAVPCVPADCQLPDCRCSTSLIPGGLAPKDTPQFVLVTFDDAVSVTNIQYYRDTLYNRVNPNGCRAIGTFFVSHEYTDYSLINELYNNDMEIALHSITHQIGTNYWAQASVDLLKAEFADQRAMMSRFANIPPEAMQGLRQPFLQMSGNNTFVMMKENGLTYDLTWGATNIELWPYTTDYLSTQNCFIPPCPTASIEGTWVLPMSFWLDSSGVFCAMVDSCLDLPTTEDGLFGLMVENFERHYLGNRAPFGFYVHAAWFVANPVAYGAYVRLLDHLSQLEDVYLVGPQKVLEWVKSPIPLSELKQSTWSDCPARFAQCQQRSCPIVNTVNQLTYWMSSCVDCPAVHPWLYNPLGEA